MNAPSRQRKSPWIVAHRGAMDEAPENTRLAFDAALAHPIDGIELDVQMTQDHVLVLFHDQDLMRISGERRCIADFTYAELQQFDWGAWHSADFTGLTLTTLAETLDRYAGRTRLLIEVKSFDEDRRSGRSLDITTHLLQSLKERIPPQDTANIFILSFDPEVINHAHRIEKGWQYVLNVGDARTSLTDTKISETRLYAYCTSIHTLDEKVISRVHTMGKKVMTYSCNTPSQVKKALDLRCDVVMTDRPRWIFEYLKSTGFMP